MRIKHIILFLLSLIFIELFSILKVLGFLPLSWWWIVTPFLAPIVVGIILLPPCLIILCVKTYHYLIRQLQKDI